MEVLPGIHRLTVPMGDRFLCVYLLVGEDAVAVLDTGFNDTPGRTLAPYLAAIGVDPDQIRYVITTHADSDHCGGNAALRETAPQAVFLCHELDRPWIEDVERLIAERYDEFNAGHGIGETEDSKAGIRASMRPTPVDIGLSGGEHIRLGPDWRVEVLHTPGHSRGHISLYDRRSRAAIIADAVLWRTLITDEGQPILPPTYRYVEPYLKTIHLLQGMEIETLLTGHYPVLQGAAVASFLAESEAYVEHVERTLREVLQTAREPLTVREIIAATRAPLGDWPEPVASYLVYPLVGHLERLAEHGQVDVELHDGRATYRWIG